MRNPTLQIAEQLDRWKSGDPSISGEAIRALHTLGPEAIIQLLRTPDEIEMLRGPIPVIRPIHLAGCVAVLSVFVLPFSWIITRMLGNPFLMAVPVSVLAGLFVYAWHNREFLRSKALGFASEQVRLALLAQDAMSLFEDPRWDNEILDNLLLKQSDGPDLVRPPAHPIYPFAMRILARMEGDHAVELLAGHQSSLARFLDPSHARDHRQLILLLIRAIGRFGGKRYLKRIKALYETRADSEPAEEVIRAAAECLQDMELRFQNEANARRLLRPSETAEYGQLLRSASGVDPHAETLLRTNSDPTNESL